MKKILSICAMAFILGAGVIGCSGSTTTPQANMGGGGPKPSVGSGAPGMGGMGGAAGMAGATGTPKP